MLEDIIRDTLFLSADAEIKDEHGPGSLDEWDSMGHVNIIVAVEESFQVQISPDEILKLQTVKDIRELLKQKGIKEV
ncbi:MAG: acyl carrier protein [Bacteroidota bacterium]